MNRYEFTIIASGLDPDSDDFEDRFFEAGCDDTTIAFVKGRIVIEFAREARNFSHALFTAIQSVQRAGATVEHIEPDYLVSLSDIAERCDLSRAAISLFAKVSGGKLSLRLWRGFQRKAHYGIGLLLRDGCSVVERFLFPA